MNSPKLEEKLVEELNNRDVEAFDDWDLGTLEKLRLEHDEARDFYAVADEYDIPLRRENIDLLAEKLVHTTIARSRLDPPRLIEQFGIAMGDLDLVERAGFEAESEQYNS